MKYLIFKTLAGKNITVKYVANQSLKMEVKKKTIAEYTSAAVIKTRPEVEVHDTKVTVGFGTNQWGMTVPRLEEGGVPLYGTKNGANTDYAVNQAAGIVFFFGVITLIFAGLTAMADTVDGSIPHIFIIIPVIIGLCCFLLAFFIKKYSLIALYIFMGLIILSILGQLANPDLLAIILSVGFLVSANNARYGVQIANLQNGAKQA
ncbi:MAG: hypothetical protein GY810_15270 [Aureispira sp.]|nr:hypothetical protein [Aureispira sp.]